jgi:hypothetical protein
MATLLTSAALSALCIVFLYLGQLTARHLGNVAGGLAALRHCRLAYPSSMREWYSFVRNQTRSSGKALKVWLPAFLASGVLLALLQQLFPGADFGKALYIFVMGAITAFYALRALLESTLTLKLVNGPALRDRQVVMAASKSFVALAAGLLLCVI